MERFNQLPTDNLLDNTEQNKDIVSVVRWLKEAGAGKNWLLGNSDLLVKNLALFSSGQPVDFLVWNCIGFKWYEDPLGSFPSCEVYDNIDAAMILYFEERLKRVYEVLSTIGNPELTILLPSNEALDENVWKYRQPYEERNSIINQAVSGLKRRIRLSPLLCGAKLEVLRWDNYLESRSASKTPEQYSQEGRAKIESSNDFERVRKEALRSGKNYLTKSGVSNITDKELIEGQIKYYGVYAGEGIALAELQDNNNPIIIINFEDLRVPQKELLGADGGLAIVTVVSDEERRMYSQWTKNASTQ